MSFLIWGIVMLHVFKQEVLRCCFCYFYMRAFFSSNFNANPPPQIIILMGYWWTIKKLGYFILKRGLKRVQNSEIFHIILMQFSLFEFIMPSDFGSTLYVGRFPLSLMVSEINSTERGQQKLNSKMWTLLFYIRY